jgi:hypothetical protein
MTEVATGYKLVGHKFQVSCESKTTQKIPVIIQKHRPNNLQQHTILLSTITYPRNFKCAAQM